MTASLIAFPGLPIDYHHFARAQTYLKGHIGRAEVVKINVRAGWISVSRQTSINHQMDSGHVIRFAQVSDCLANVLSRLCSSQG